MAKSLLFYLKGCVFILLRLIYFSRTMHKIKSFTRFWNARYGPHIVDLIAMLLLLLFALLFAIRYVNFDVHPIEDAAILMRYAQHLAQGYGIVWNIGEPPVDGATDFLFMVAVGGLVKAGMSLELAARFLGLASHILTVEVVYLSLRRLFNTPWLAAFGTGAFLIVGPGFYYVASYFGTTFFALFACLSWWAALTIIQNEETPKKSLLFALTSVTTGLIRPEGVFLTGFMLLAILFIKGWRASRYSILYFIGTFLLIGGMYFLWRWQYFGYPLPNPFYKKGGGLIHMDGLNASYVHTLTMCLLLWPAFIAGLFFAKTARKTIGFLIPIVGFTLSFILLSNNTNFLGRYQYAVLPIAAMVCWPITQGIREWVKLPDVSDMSLQQRLFFSALMVIIFAGAMKFEYDMSHVWFYDDGKYAVATMLSEYEGDGLRLATSESGLLPLYSQWKSLDAWGLNDQWIAHHGGMITEDYLKSFDPDIIVFHAYFSPITSSKYQDAWYEMVMVLKNYAEKNGYILAAAYGENPYETEYYYVRSNLPESAAIVASIRGMDYYSGLTGDKLTNYALEAGK